MGTNTNQALPHARLDRNRAAFTTAIVVITACCIAMMLKFSMSARPGPLLLSIDEMSALSTSPVEESPIAPVALAPVMEMPEASVKNELQAEVVTEPAAEPEPNVPRFNGRPVRPVRTITMVVTAYSPDSQSCGESADGITASGYSVWTNGMKLAAADTRLLPFGTMISVPGYDNEQLVPVLDRGSAIKGNRLDILFPTHEVARKWGRQRLKVTVWEYADGKPSDFVARYK